MTSIKIEVPLLKAALLTTAEYLKQLSTVIVEEAVASPAIATVDVIQPADTLGGVDVVLDGEVIATIKDETTAGTSTKVGVNEIVDALTNPAANPTPPPPPADTEDIKPVYEGTPVDSMGQPHDSRIHAESKLKTAKAGKFGPSGIWKVIRGTDIKKVEEVRTHWNGLGFTPGATPPDATTEAAAPAPPAADAPTPPPAAPTPPLTPDERMTDEANGVSYQAYIDAGWDEPTMIAKGIMLAETTVEALPAMDFLTLVTTKCVPNVEAELITNDDIDNIVGEVSGGTVAALALLATGHDDLIPEVAASIDEFLE